MAFATHFTCVIWHISKQKILKMWGGNYLDWQKKCFLMIAGGGEGLKNVEIYHFPHKSTCAIHSVVAFRFVLLVLNQEVSL